MKRSLVNVPTKDLLWKDHTYRSSLDRESVPLARSLAKVGILVPLRLQIAQEGLRVVSGFLRAEAAAGLGWETLPAELMEPGDPLSTLLACLHENNFTRGFTWAERTWVLERVIQNWDAPRDWLLRELLPAMGLPPSPKILEEHFQASSIREDLRRALVRQGCSLANALRLSRMHPQDQEAFVALLPSLHLGENLMREVLELLWEIQRRDGVPPREILSDEELLRAMAQRGEDRPQRTNVLRRHLLKIRMPNLTSMEESFHKARGALGLPSRISIQHGEFFESPGLTVGFTAKTYRDFIEMTRKLWEASQNVEVLKVLFQAVRAPGSHPEETNRTPV